MAQRKWVLLLILTVLGAHLVTRHALHPNQPELEQPASLYSVQLRDDLRRLFVDAIASAKEEVVLSSYGLADPRIIHALRDKAEEGVPVHVLVDRAATKNAHQLLGPHIHTVQRSSEGLMHIKALVIDGTTSFLGSANFTFSSLRIHSNLMLGIAQKDLSRTIRNYLLGLPAKGRHSPPDMPYVIDLANQMTTLWLCPQEAALQALLELIRQANSSLHIAMFTWTHPLITEAVINAYHRGVDVAIVMDRDQGKGVNKKVLDELRQQDIPTYLSDGDGLLHHKLAIIDGTTLVVGSANWTRSAFQRNDDCFLVLQPLTNQQKDKLARLWSICLHDSDRHATD